MLKNYRFYITVVCIAWYGFRVTTFMSWMGSGWPEWVASGFETESDKIDHFSNSINDFMSVANLAVVGLNIFSGGIVDWCRTKSSDDRLGTALGLIICYSIVTVSSLSNSFFAAFQVKWTAYLSVSSLLFGRGFSTLWAPMIQLLFPMQFFGVIFGVLSVISILFNLTSVPIFAFIEDTYDYSVISYIFSALTVLIAMLPIGKSGFKTLLVMFYITYQYLNRKKSHDQLQTSNR